ncbi:LysR family transcriptional regulator [Flavisphingomonas formosensis]|uniref:LysR family transcriptional regulator n=1 Tax=Flavisphingomonas formosensis TaxID=861534 RepID=UPI0012F9B02A|nr:LysR family transcriptional regulator [Sphingomonas formosensis]
MAYDGRLLSGVTVLMAVVEAGSIVRAAGAIGLSPSGASRALARLEARVGIRLIDRTTRALSLTDEGRRFYESVAPHLAAIEEAAHEAAGSASLVRGRLRVNVDPFFARIVLADRIAAFLGSHPDLSLELVARDAVGDLVADGFDLAIRFGDPPTGSFVARKLTDTRILTVASPAYLATRGRPSHPSDLADHDCIDFLDVGTGRPFAWEFHRKGTIMPVTFRSRLLLSDSNTLLDVCVAGAGIAQVLEIGTRAWIRSGALVDLFPDWAEERFPLYALFPSRHHRAAKVRAFIDFCEEMIAAHEALG